MDLSKLFKIQKEYNDRIKAESRNISADYWTETYLLGMISEVDEVLREINWKKHRGEITSSHDLYNIGIELADLTKYVISLWTTWGFTSEEALQFCYDKSTALESIHRMDRSFADMNQPVVVCDLDGTICDWRATFVSWLAEIKGIRLDLKDPSLSMMIDSDLSIEYSKYNKIKEEFESRGMYRHLFPYEDGINALKFLKQRNYFLVFYTARPVKQFKRIFLDTLVWLQRFDIKPDKLYFGNEERILMASRLSENHKVIMFEDDPSLIIRACNNGIKVIARKQPYNENITHKNLVHVSSYI